MRLWSGRGTCGLSQGHAAAAAGESVEVVMVSGPLLRPEAALSVGEPGSGLLSPASLAIREGDEGAGVVVGA